MSSSSHSSDVRLAVAARRVLVALYPCADCGAPAGAECRPEYGCSSADRRPFESHSVQVDRLAGPPYAPAEVARYYRPDLSEPAECRHGYSSGCPDCDVPSYWPSVLDG